MASDSSNSEPSSPDASGQSRGSSVSTGLREEYEDLLRYAVVTPNFDGKVKGVLKSKSDSSQPVAVSGPGVHSVEVSHLELPEDEESSEEIVTSPDPPISPPKLVSSPLPDRNSQYHSEHYSMAHRQQFPSNITLQFQAPHTDPLHKQQAPPSISNPQLPSQTDPELTRLDAQLDVWCQDLKRHVLAEFEQAQLRAREQQRAQLAQETERLVCQQQQLESQLSRTKALLVTYEQSVNRKDQIIQSLTKSLQKQKERIGLARTFSVWRARHNDEKREVFTSALARKQYHFQLKRKILRCWFGLIQGKWRDRVQKACQIRAEEVCHQLKADHHEQMATMQQCFEEAQTEITCLRKERDLFEENMKKAFMRGVCALNMEAMSMFQQPVEVDRHDNHAPPPPPPTLTHETYPTSKSRREKEPKIKIERHLH